MKPYQSFLPGAISLSRPQGDDCDFIKIELVDKSSGVEFIEIHIPYAEFAQLLTGLSRVDCSFEVRSLNRIGTKAENKEVFVPFDYYKTGRDDKAAIQKALEPFEVDGWHAREGDLTNGHRHTERNGVRGQMVVFFRHVDAKGNPVLS